MGVLNECTLKSSAGMGATFATRWVATHSCYSIIFQMSSSNTSTPVGAWTVEETNDPQAEFETRSADGDSTASTAKAINISADTSRVTIIGTGLTVGAANETEVVVLNPARFVRLKYTRTSGGTTAVLNVWATGRE